MRWLIRLVVLGAALWAGWWVLGAHFIERGLRDALAGAQRSGVTVQDSGVSGFPNRWDVTLTEPRLADPVTGITTSAPFVQAFTLTWKPWHLIAALPELSVAAPDGSAATLAGRMRASLRLRPTAALPLEALRISGTDLTLARLAPDGPARRTAAERAELATRRLADPAETHQIALTVTGLAPDPASRPPATPLPPVIDRLAVDAAATFSAPLDRTAGQTRPHVTAIDLRAAGLTWGALHVTATGRLAADTQGLAQGQIDIRIDDWNLALDALVATGILRPEMRPTWAEFARRLAEMGNTGAGLDLPLTMSRGRMALGPLPLGPAPALVPQPTG